MKPPFAQGEADWPVSPRNLLTVREKILYERLLALYPSDKIFIQVALSQLIDVDPNRPDRESIRARYKQLVADFVLCRPDLSVIAVIELDDRSHFALPRRRADARKTKALTDAGIRLVRIPAGAIPSERGLRAIVEADPRVAKNAENHSMDEMTHTPHKSAEKAWRIILFAMKQAALFCVVAAIIWFTFNTYILTVAQQSLQATALRVAASNSAQRSRGAAAQKDTSTTNGAAGPDTVDRRQVEILAAAHLQRQKMQAWAAYYSPPANCEHPADWGAQVECGNHYMRAKKLFESQWAAGRPTVQSSASMAVLDNSSVAQKSR